MSAMGRVIGHGLGGFFMIFGLIFLLLGANDAFTSIFDGGFSCTGSSCASDSVRTTFLTLGASFFFGGLLTSVITEFTIRKTRKLVSTVSEIATHPGDTDDISKLLRGFGIAMDLSKANVSVERPLSLDLRSQRKGRKVPTDPAELSEYLKSFGVTVDEEVLKQAAVVQGGQIVQPGTPVVTTSTAAASPVAGSAAMFQAPTQTSEGERQTATIVRKTDRGATAGNQRLLELEIEVTPAGKAPYRVTVASLVRESLAGLLIEGSSLNVRVNPNDKNAVTIDWGEN